MQCVYATNLVPCHLAHMQNPTSIKQSISYVNNACYMTQIINHRTCCRPTTMQRRNCRKWYHHHAMRNALLQVHKETNSNAMSRQREKQHTQVDCVRIASVLIPRLIPDALLSGIVRSHPLATMHKHVYIVAVLIISVEFSR